MPATQRCCCKTRKCGEQKDSTGQPGVILSLRAWKEHQNTDKNVELQDRALKSQGEALRAQEEDMVRAIEAMSINPPEPVRVSESQIYQIDRVKKVVENLSDITEELEHIQVQALQIGKPQPSASDQVVESSLQKITRLNGSLVEINKKIMLSARGPLRNTHAIVEARKSTERIYGDTEILIKDTEALWNVLLLEKYEKLEINLANGAMEYDSSDHFAKVLEGSKPVVQLAILTVVACHVILGLPRRGCVWIFTLVRYIIQVIAQAIYGDSLPNYWKDILSDFPRDVRTATDQFHLEPKATVYAACPKCHCTYKPTDEGGIPHYRERCNFHRHGSRCGELLVRPKMMRNYQIFVPIKPYVAFDFKDWMAGLLSRRGYEEMLDKAWERMALPRDGNLTDIFQGSAIREFKGPDGQTHFSAAGGKDAGRYLFSLGFDFFNPLRNLAGGKKVSVGVIALACLNFPIELRHKPENMFLAGIIPGPHEPSLDAINHYIRPIVDVFIQFWAGVRFTRTFLYNLGRLILCALILVICDLPAARKIGGFASHSHEHYCSVCNCTKTEHQGYNNFKYSTWDFRNGKTCRVDAEKFRDASTPEEANRIFDSTGQRWSELLRLTYYDPTKFLAVDPMHNLFLGLIKEHFQNILGNRPKSKNKRKPPPTAINIQIPTDPTNPLPLDKPARASVRRLLKWLEQPLDQDSKQPAARDALENLWSGSKTHVVSLVYVGRGVGCFPETMDQNGCDTIDSQKRRISKLDLAKKLVNWRLEQIPDMEGDEPAESVDVMIEGSIFTAAEMEALWQDLEHMVKPSWVTSVPTTLSSSGPKLKSDQWRTIGSLYLPVTLIRLWSNTKSDDGDSMKRRELLHLTMLLLSAIAAATSRVTSADHVRTYLSHMTAYRMELQRLFPFYACHCNHHMAMHIGEFLTRYGPVYGWWTFPYERMIGVLQRISTNYKPGEYEETIGRSWHRSSNFRALFTKDTCPQPIQHCIDFFEALVRPQNHNSLSTDAIHQLDEFHEDEELEDDDKKPITSSEKGITDDVRAAIIKKLPPGSIIPRTAKFTNRIIHNGISYTTRKTHEGNSGVFFQGLNAPFSIDKIIQLRENTTGGDRNGTWLVVQRYRKPKVTIDPYARYPDLRAQLWHHEPEQSIEIFPVSEVDAHFAKLAIPWEDQTVAVIVSLSRVRPG